MGSRGRGGYQKPGNPAGASPPGALSQRTVNEKAPSTQPITPIRTGREGGKQGDRKASIEQQRAMPMYAAPDPSAPGEAERMAAGPPPIPGDQVWGPTERPWEPVTAGASLGAGPTGGDGLLDFYRGLYQRFPYDDLREVIEELEAG